MPNKLHFPHPDQTRRYGYGSMQHNPARTVITACGLVFNKQHERDRFTTRTERVTCGSCITNAHLEPIRGRRTHIPYLRVIDGGGTDDRFSGTSSGQLSS